MVATVMGACAHGHRQGVRTATVMRDPVGGVRNVTEMRDPVGGVRTATVMRHPVVAARGGDNRITHYGRSPDPLAVTAGERT